MSKYGTEQVLATPREVVEDIFAEEIQNVGNTAFWMCKRPDAARATIEQLIGAGGFLLRDEAETREDLKQPIPYCLIVYSGVGGDLVLHYSRAKEDTPEARLAGKRSFGVGGHINPVDTASEGTYEFYLNALYRELDEEFGIKKDMVQDLFTLGFVNDEENAVGRVHVGIVHAIVVNTTEFEPREKHLVDDRWDTIHEVLLEENLETWTVMIADKLDDYTLQNPSLLSEWDKAWAPESMSADICGND